MNKNPCKQKNFSKIFSVFICLYELCSNKNAIKCIETLKGNSQARLGQTWYRFLAKRVVVLVIKINNFQQL